MDKKKKSLVGWVLETWKIDRDIFKALKCEIPRVQKYTDFPKAVKVRITIEEL